MNPPRTNPVLGPASDFVQKADEYRQKADDLYDLGVRLLGACAGLIKLRPDESASAPDVGAITRNIDHNSALLARKFAGAAEDPADSPPNAPLTKRIAHVETQIDTLKKIPFAPIETVQMAVPSALGLPGIPASGPDQLDISDSAGIAIGNSSIVELWHRCDVEKPVIELAQLVDPPGGSAAAAKSSRKDPRDTLTTYETRLKPGVPVHIDKSGGLVFGNWGTVKENVRTTLKGCPLHVPKLLANKKISDLVQAAWEAGDDSAAREEIKSALAKEIHAEAKRLGPGAVIQNFHERARDAYGAEVGFLRGRLVVAHINGLAVGAGNELRIKEYVRMDPPTIR